MDEKQLDSKIPNKMPRMFNIENRDYDSEKHEFDTCNDSLKKTP